MPKRVTKTKAGHAKKDDPWPVKLFRTLGVDFISVGEDEAVAECPWCEKEKLYVNVESGQYDCKVCDESGNHFTYLREYYNEALEETSDTHYHDLKAKRGISLQTLKRHELAFDTRTNNWLIPFKNKDGQVVNLQRYNLTTGKKYNLPGLKMALYGLDGLSNDASKHVLLCEGPFDAIALDYHLLQNRHKYDIIATPGPFQSAWVEHFRDRKVRCLFDNDKGGEQHTKRARELLGESAAELRVLKWPEGFPEGCDINDLVKDYGHIQILGWSREHSIKVAREPKIVWSMGEVDKDDEPDIDWLWPDHLPCGTYTSFSGEGGTLKSTIMRDIAARYTSGKNMPDGQPLGIPPGCVIYVTAEDRKSQVRKSFKLHGGDLSKITILDAQLENGEVFNFLELQADFENGIRTHGVRLVILDGQNSLIGNPNYSSDTAARSSVSQPLHNFAQKYNIVLVGIRNEDPHGRAMGPQSMSDVGRCIWRTKEVTKQGESRSCLLQFKKVTEALPQEPIAYGVKSVDDLPQILWRKEHARKVANGLKNSRKRASKKPYTKNV